MQRRSQTRRHCVMKASLSELSSPTPISALILPLKPSVLAVVHPSLPLPLLRASTGPVIPLPPPSPPDPPTLCLAAAGDKLEAFDADGCGGCMARIACDRCRIGGGGTRVFRKPLHSFATWRPAEPPCTGSGAAGGHHQWRSYWIVCSKNYYSCARSETSCPSC